MGMNSTQRGMKQREALF